MIRWLHLTIAALCVTTGGVWVLKNQKEFQAAAATIRGAVNEFMSEHLIEPIQYVLRLLCSFHCAYALMNRLVSERLLAK